jgi:mono/diheme cytochrome c family protein
MNYKRFLAITSMVALTLPAFAAGPDGAAIYKAKCASCHGADGNGQTPMGKAWKLRDLGAADVQKLSDADLTKITTDGKGKMPAYKGKLTDAEIAAVVAHMRSFKK